MDKYKLDFNTEEGKKYISIYNHIKKLIQNGDILDNEKLPPIRSLSKLLKVNNTTVVKAYELLQSEGYLYKILGSGTFASINSPKILNNTKDKDMIYFDSGNPSEDIFPIEDFKKAVNCSLSDSDSRIFEYDDGQGNINLRIEIMKYMKNLSINTSVENIQVISGAQQGIDIVCKGLVNYSDVVFVEEPTYNGAIEVFKGRGAKIISVPMLEDGIDIGILKLKLEKIRPKAFYVMPNFQNPTGISYSEYKKKKLLELAEEYNFYIIEDDFISDFKFDSENNRTIRSYDENGKVIYIKSFSKIFMPGLRIGIVDIPNELMNRIMWAKYSSDISTPGLIQLSFYFYMKEFGLENHISDIEEIYYMKYKVAKESIDKYFKNNISTIKNSGGINFFCRLSNGYSAQRFSEYLYSKGIAVIPGLYFFDNHIDDRYFRINIAKESVENIRKGIKLISEYAEEFLKIEVEGKNHINNRTFY